METPALDEVVGLHEEIEIIYVVDGFEASLLGNNGLRILDKAHGETVELALNKLEILVAARK